MGGSVLTDGVWQSVTPGNGVAPSSPATVSASVGFKELGGRDKKKKQLVAASLQMPPIKEMMLQ